MDLDAYAARLQRDLHAVAATAREEVAEATDRLAAVLDSSVRVVLLDAVVEAAAEIGHELTPGSVEVRLHGRDVGFAVTTSHDPSGPGPAERIPTAGAPADSDEGDAGDAGTARLSLRLPERLKPRVEQAAAAAGLSVNAWLVRSIGALLEAGAPAPGTPAATRPDPLPGRRHTGWVR